MIDRVQKPRPLRHDYVMKYARPSQFSVCNIDNKAQFSYSLQCEGLVYVFNDYRKEARSSYSNNSKQRVILITVRTNEMSMQPPHSNSN